MANELRNCPAPAKLNLFLHVIGRREDGYHLLQTVFQLIDHGDLLHFSLRSDEVICRTTPVDGVPEESDLIIRAARLLQSEAKKRTGSAVPGADIAIEKNLPMGGGLGGGSSDAATTLMALNHLWRAGMTRADLMEIGLQLGADVPFFLFGQNAFAEGVGEILTPINTPDGWYVIIEPGVSIPTASIFRSQELTRNTEPVKMTDFSNSAIDLGAFGRNDLQVVASRLFPPVAAAIKWLEQYAEARMTGSGACVFARFTNEQAADAVLEKLPCNWKGWKAQAMKMHPLKALLEE